MSPTTLLRPRRASCRPRCPTGCACSTSRSGRRFEAGAGKGCASAGRPRWRGAGGIALLGGRHWSLPANPGRRRAGPPARAGAGKRRAGRHIALEGALPRRSDHAGEVVAQRSGGVGGARRARRGVVPAPRALAPAHPRPRGRDRGGPAGLVQDARGAQPGPRARAAASGAAQAGAGGGEARRRPAAPRSDGDAPGGHATVSSDFRSWRRARNGGGGRPTSTRRSVPPARRASVGDSRRPHAATRLRRGPGRRAGDVRPAGRGADWCRSGGRGGARPAPTAAIDGDRTVGGPASTRRIWPSGARAGRDFGLDRMPISGHRALDVECGGTLSKPSLRVSADFPAVGVADKQASELEASVRIPGLGAPDALDLDARASSVSLGARAAARADGQRAHRRPARDRARGDRGAPAADHRPRRHARAGRPEDADVDALEVRYPEATWTLRRRARLSFAEGIAVSGFELGDRRAAHRDRSARGRPRADRARRRVAPGSRAAAARAGAAGESVSAVSSTARSGRKARAPARGRDGQAGGRARSRSPRPRARPSGPPRTRPRAEAP